MQIHAYTQGLKYFHTHAYKENIQQTTMATTSTTGATEVKHLFVQVYTGSLLRGSGHRIIGHASAYFWTDHVHLRKLFLE